MRSWKKNGDLFKISATAQQNKQRGGKMWAPWPPDPNNANGPTSLHWSRVLEHVIKVSYVWFEGELRTRSRAGLKSCFEGDMSVMISSSFGRQTSTAYVSLQVFARSCGVCRNADTSKCCRWRDSVWQKVAERGVRRQHMEEKEIK